MRSLLAKVRDLESRIQREDKDRRKRNPSRQANNIEIDLVDLKALDQETGPDENGDEKFASQVVDAYLAEVNLVDSSNFSKAWYVDSGASNHVTRGSSIFPSLSHSSGPR